MNYVNFSLAPVCPARSNLSRQTLPGQKILTCIGSVSDFGPFYSAPKDLAPSCFLSSKKQALTLSSCAVSSKSLSSKVSVANRRIVVKCECNCEDPSAH